MGQSKRRIRRALILLFWLGVWQLAAWKMDNQILLTGPLEVGKTLVKNVQTVTFWKICLNSFCHIFAGFGIAFVLAAVLGVLSGFWKLLEEMLSPFMQLMKAVPVASIVVLVLIWTGSARMSVMVVFLMVFPIIYFGFLSGVKSVNEKTLEMAEVFRFSWFNRMLYLYRPALMPFVLTACRSALGMSWKAGVAAEVIGVPSRSIGERIYLSKIYLNTADLFAWTLVVIVLSFCFEHVILLVLDRIAAAKWKPAFLHKPVNMEKTPFQVQELSKAYGERRVLEHVNHTFEPGICYCITGESGSGKTTLFQMLWQDKTQRCAVVFQEDRLLESENAIVNVMTAMAKGCAEQTVIDALETLLPAEALRQPVRELSGGMRRRVSICRAMLAESTCVILDEPFNGLDEENKVRTAEFIRREQRGKILLMATHNREEAELLHAELLELEQLQNR